MCSNEDPCLLPMLRWVHSEKCKELTQPRIILNARVIPFPKATISYEDIVALCDCGRSKECLHSIVYEYPRNEAHGITVQAGTGSVIRGQKIPVVNGMHISAAVTDNA